MGKSRRVILALAAILVLAGMRSTDLHAQECPRIDIGVYQSPKGFGLSIEPFKDSLSFNSYTILADMFGVLTGDYVSPGFKFTYCRKFIFKQHTSKDYKLDLYGGPGLTAGMSRDFHDPMGFTAGLHGALGGRYSYARKISISLEISSDIAFKMHTDQRGATEMGFYKAGIIHALYPEVRIQYNIK